MENIDIAGNILTLLRRIIRSIDQHNKQLSSRYKLTIPQLVCIRQLSGDGPMTAGQLAKAVYLSQATITGIIDRLETKDLATRSRSTSDRRKWTVSLTPEGERMAREMPWPLQERFAQGLASLSEDKQQQIHDVLCSLVEMMEAPVITVWPYGGVDTVKPEEIDPPIE